MQAPPPSPRWAEVTRRLAAAGICAEIVNERLTVRFAPPEEGCLGLARPLPHPWLRERELAQIGLLPEVAGADAVAQANARLARMLDSGVPAGLLGRAAGELAERVCAYCDELLTPLETDLGGFTPRRRGSLLRFHARELFSGRTVLTPGGELALDQLGLPEEMAWALFGPLVARQIGNAEEVAARSERAATTLDEIDRPAVERGRAASRCAGSSRWPPASETPRSAILYRDWVAARPAGLRWTPPRAAR